MNTSRLLKTSILVLLLLGFVRSNAQTNVYATYITDSSSDFQNAYRAVDNNHSNYAYLSNLLTLLSTSYLRVGFNTSGKAGDEINIVVQGTGQVLNTSLLSNVTVRLYDSLGNNVANVTGSSLLQLYLLSPASNIYAIRFLTNPTDTFKFKQVRVEFNNVLSVGLLPQFRVYDIYYQQPCPPVLANSVHAYGTNTALTGYVTNPGDAVDASTSNFATLVVPLNLLSLLPPAYLDLGFPTKGKGGDYVGFTVSQSSSLLSLGLLSNINITVYNDAGAVVASQNGFSLANLQLLNGTSGEYMLGFQTPAGSYNIARAMITLNGVLGLLQNVNVYNAFHYSFNTAPVQIVASGPLNVCAGGSVTLTAIDSTGSNQFLWSTGDTSRSITVHAAGTYSVQSVDSQSCDRYSVPVTVTFLPQLVPTIAGDTVLCPGLSGVLHTTAIYKKYLWNTGDTTASISAPNSGRYYVAVTDTNNCTGTDTVTVNRNNFNVTAIINNATCTYSGDGSIALSVSGGSGVYSYLWSTGITGSAIASLPPGLYTCIVKDSVYGCTKTVAYTVAVKSNLSIQASVINTSDSGKTDGAIEVKGVGGSGNYSYLWNTGATTPTINNLAAGLYSVTLSDNVYGCSLKDTLGLSDGNNPLAVTVNTANNGSCNTTTGSATVNVTGGSGNYSYLWSTGATTAGISGLGAGTYYVSVHDNVKNYTKIAVAVIGNTSSPVISGAVTNTSCSSYTGAIAAIVTGGSGSYTYHWSNGSTATSITNLAQGTYLLKVIDNTTGCTQQTSFAVNQTGGPSAMLVTTAPLCSSNAGGSIMVTAISATNKYLWSTGATTQDISGLTAGNYTLTVMDSLTGCSTNYSATLNPRRQLLVSAEKANNTACPSAANGSLSLVVSGGVAPYTYAWSTGAAVSSVTHLSAGTYSVNVSDNNGCSDSLTAAIVTDSSKTLHVAIGAITAASCGTAANGSIAAAAGGGVAPYTYHWSNGVTTASLTNAIVGVYTLTVTDALGCTDTASARITVDTAHEIKIIVDSVINANCSGGTPGAVYIHAIRGTLPYTYLWNTGAIIPSITGLAGGVYTVVATDAIGCKDTATANVSIASSLVIAVNSITPASCATVANGGVNVGVTGGTAPYVYSWSNGASSVSIANVAAGSYSLVVTDAAGCRDTSRVQVNIDTTHEVRIIIDSVINAACSGIGTGKIYTHASMGTLPYAYAWNTGAVTPSVTGLMAGAYTVTVTDSIGCKDTATVAIPANGAPVVTVSSVTATSCSMAANGGASVNITGGTAPYSYTWSNGSSSASLAGVTAGSYSVVVTDGVGCKDTANVYINVDTVNEVRIVLDSVINIGCTGISSGKIYTHASLGVSPYTYSWSISAITPSVSGLVAGTYTLTVTDAVGCKDTAAATISGNTAPVVTVSSVTAPSCNTIANGGALINITGGTAPYSYSWSNGSAAATLTNAAAGSYSVVVTDASGCKDTANIAINVDTANVIRIVVDSVISAGCTGISLGKIYTHASHGVLPYTYMWNTGVVTPTITGLVAGAYTITVTDSAGCKDTATANVLGTPAPVIAVTSTTATSCGTVANGGASVNVTGGTAPYVYSWSNGSASATLAGVVAGSYSLVVTDGVGCKDTANVAINVDTANEVRIVIDSVLNAGCTSASLGRIYTHALMGRAPYTYLWNTGISAPSISGLLAGSYTVTVTDSVGCKDTATANVLSFPSPVVSVNSTTATSCNTATNGGATVNITGGTGPYTYSWSNGSVGSALSGVAVGTYSLVVTDGAGCKDTANVAISIDTVNVVRIAVDSVINAGCTAINLGKIYTHASMGTTPYTYLWSNGVSTSSVINLGIGSYSVVVTDATGCKDTATANILSDPAPVITIGSVTSAACNTATNGGVNINVTSGTAPYTYSWSNGSIGAGLINVAAGTYTLVVTDGAGCKDTASVQITADTANQVKVIIDSTLSVNCVNANSGGIYAHALLGTMPYTYLWSNGATISSLIDIAIGVYSVMVTDANGCSGTAMANITKVAVPMIIPAVTDVKCHGGDNGSITVTATGGSGLYNYSWSNGASSAGIANLALGTYTLTLTDTKTGCVVSDTIQLTQPDALQVAITITNETCAGNNGSISINVAGGTPPYSYIWQGNPLTSLLTNLLQGSYTMLIGDANGCDTSVTAIVAKDNCDTMLNIHNVITPNGDGVNDIWVIEGISNYPNASVQIFDKWGDVVYSHDHYSNTWNGTDNNGVKLVSGTYYYLLKLNAPNLNGGKSEYTGFIMVQQ